MKMINLDVEGLTDEQIELARQFVDLMKKAGERKEALKELRILIQKGIPGEYEISEEEADRIAAETVAYARDKR